MQNSLHSETTEAILGCCFDIVNELGSGFLESVYKNALIIAMTEKRLKVEAEKRFDVIFRERKIGFYIADIVVESSVIVELKCFEILPEHKAQLINYLKVSGIQIGFLVGFDKKRLDYNRLYHPDQHSLYLLK
jgi:GxxExxY protein